MNKSLMTECIEALQEENPIQYAELIKKLREELDTPKLSGAPAKMQTFVDLYHITATEYPIFVLGFLSGEDYTKKHTQQPPVAHSAAKSDMLVNGGALKLALNSLRRGTQSQTEIADELEKTARRIETGDYK